MMNPDFVFESDVVPIFPRHPHLAEFTHQFRMEFIQYPPGTRSIMTASPTAQNQHIIQFKHPWLIFGHCHCDTNHPTINSNSGGFIFGSQNKITDVFKHSGITVPHVKDHISGNGRICFGRDLNRVSIRPTSLADVVYYFWNTTFRYVDFSFLDFENTLHEVASLITGQTTLKLVGTSGLCKPTKV